MVITVMLIAQEQHANQDSQCLMVKNAEGIAERIKLGSALITAVNAKLTNLCKMDFALIVTQHVGHVGILVI
jgi:hypothetical protein